MNKDSKMIETLIEIDKQMKEAQEQVSNYIIKQTEENTWIIINEDEKVIDTITKDTVVNYCKKEYENNGSDCLEIEIMIDSVWWNLQDDYNLELIDAECQYWNEFLTWFDNICAEYVKQEIVGIYKQRLLNFE